MSVTSKGFPLFLTFDVDAETMWTARDPAYAKRPILMSQGNYGCRLAGVPRVLALLARHEVKATFFVPGVVALAHPDMVRAIVDQGHEVAHHSHTHRWIVNLTPEEEREEMELGLTAGAHRRLSAAGLALAGGRVQRDHAGPDPGIRLRLLVEFLRRRFALSAGDRRPGHGYRGAALSLGAGRCPVLPVFDRVAGPHHAIAFRRAGGLEARVRRVVRRGPHDDAGHAPRDHRPALAPIRAGRDDPLCQGARAGLDRPLRRDDGRYPVAAASAA